MNDKQNNQTGIAHKLKSLLWLFVKIAVAAGIFTWLIMSHYTEFIHVVINMDFTWLIFAFFLYAATQIAQGFRWYWLLKIQKIHVTFWEAISLTMQGIFFSLVIPGGAMGGDLVRTGFLISRTEKGKKLAATSTVFMDRFFGMFGQFSIGIIMTIICYNEIKNMDRIMQSVIMLIFIVSIIGIGAGCLILWHKKLEKFKIFSSLMKTGDKITKGFVSSSSEIIDIYNKYPKTMIYCTLIGVFVQIAMGVCLALVSIGIHSQHFFFKPEIFAITYGNTAGLLPITPAGLGTRDTVIKSILSAGGYQIGNAIAIPLLLSTIILAFSILCGIFFVIDKKFKKKGDILRKEKMIGE